MELQEKELLREKLPDYLRERGIRIEKPFRCLNQAHEDRHPSMSYYRKGQVVKCFACGYTADIFDLYGEEMGLDIKTQFSDILDGLKTRYLPGTAPASQGQAASYLRGRGLSEKTIRHFRAKEHRRYRMGEMTIGPCVVLPYGERTDYAIVRETGRKRFWKPEGREEPLAFPELLDQLERSVCIVESYICAMSAYECGHLAIPLNGTGTERLCTYLSELKKCPPLLLCLDRDGPGKIAEDRLAAFLKEHGIRFYRIPSLLGCKDLNELLCAENGKRLLTEVLEKADQAISQEPEEPKAGMPNLLEYIRSGYRKKSEGPELLTGFDRLDDQINNVRSGLYLLGGIPSSGKTTFLLQMACNFAAQGKEVLYVSYEMGKRELVDKTLSRLSLEMDTRFEPQDIPDLYEEELDEALALFEKIAEKLYVLDNHESIGEIEEAAKKYPDAVLIVDYIQVIPGVSGGTKERQDEVIDRLYQISRTRPLFVISSFNRAAYWSPAGMDSFKGSGDLEFRCDVCFALQYQALTRNQIFLSDNRYGEKRRVIEMEKKRRIRNMELVCLKNRFGASGFSISLSYDTAHQNFEEERAVSTKLKCI